MPSEKEGYDVLVQVRSPEYIKELGKRHGFKGTVLGLADIDRDPCLIVVPPLDITTLRVFMHEMKHCREGRFHSDNRTTR